MKINSAIRYTIKQFINYFFSSYTLFSYRTISVYAAEKGYEEDGSVLINDFYLPFAIRFGSSKLCLEFDEEETEYVFKIPLYHSLEKSFETKYSKLVRFGAKNGKYEIFNSTEDLCKKEADIYADAEELGIGFWFAAEEKVMDYHGIPVYAQEKLETTFYNSEKFWNAADDVINAEIETLIINLGSPKELCELADNVAFIEDIYINSDPEEFKELLAFIANRNINDLHDENIGYDMYGAPKIMDYSGFEPNTNIEKILA